MNQINSVTDLLRYALKIYFKINILSKPRFSKLVFLSVFPSSILYVSPLSPHTRLMPWLSHSPWFKKLNTIWRGTQNTKFCPVSFTSSLLGPNLFLSTQFSVVLSPYSYHNTRDQYPHPHITTGNIAFRFVSFLTAIYDLINPIMRRSFHTDERS